MDGGYMPKKNTISFKGTSNGLFIHMEEDVVFEEILLGLKTLSQKSKQFYKGGTVIGVIGRKLNYSQKADLEKALIDNFDLYVDSLENSEQNTMPKNTLKKTERIEEAPALIEKKIEKPIEAKVEDLIPAEKPNNEVPVVSNRAHYVFGTMRSGKSVEHSGDVVVIGDVNPGAVIVAEGNIFVMGRVLGFVHAGSAGDENAFVVANLLKPTQIRISKYISVPPNDEAEPFAHGIEKAFVQDGMIRIETIH